MSLHVLKRSCAYKKNECSTFSLQNYLEIPTLKDKGGKRIKRKKENGGLFTINFLILWVQLWENKILYKNIEYQPKLEKQKLRLGIQNDKNCWLQELSSVILLRHLLFRKPNFKTSSTNFYTFFSNPGILFPLLPTFQIQLNGRQLVDNPSQVKVCNHHRLLACSTVPPTLLNIQSSLHNEKPV